MPNGKLPKGYKTHKAIGQARGVAYLTPRGFRLAKAAGGFGVGRTMKRWRQGIARIARRAGKARKR